MEIVDTKILRDRKRENPRSSLQFRFFTMDELRTLVLSGDGHIKLTIKLIK